MWENTLSLPHFHRSSQLFLDAVLVPSHSGVLVSSSLYVKPTITSKGNKNKEQPEVVSCTQVATDPFLPSSFLWVFIRARNNLLFLRFSYTVFEKKTSKPYQLRNKPQQTKSPGTFCLCSIHNNEVQARGIPLFCQVISYIGKDDFRERQWHWTENDVYSLVLLQCFIITKVSPKPQISGARKCTQTSGMEECLLFLGKSRFLLPLQNESVERKIRQIYNTMELHVSKFRRFKNRLAKGRHLKQLCFAGESS